MKNLALIALVGLAIPLSDESCSQSPRAKAFAATVLQCFHPGDTYRAHHLNDGKDDGTTGWIDYSGGVSGINYRMEVMFTLRKNDEGKEEFKVIPTKDGALFGASSDCRFRNWSPMKDFL